MKSYKKTLFGSIIAFFIGSSCCWLSSLVIWVSGAMFTGIVASVVKDIQIVLVGLGIVLFITTLFLYSRIKR